VASKFLHFPETEGRSLADFSAVGTARPGTEGGLSALDVEEILNRQAQGLNSADLATLIQDLSTRRRQEQRGLSVAGISQSVVERTGVPQQTWTRAGQELFEAMMPFELGTPSQRSISDPPSQISGYLGSIGLSTISLISDYPILVATYGFSRGDSLPNQCWLNPFPPEREHGAKFPIYVDQIQADAVLVQLDAERVCTWLQRNGGTVVLPRGTDLELSRQSYFVQLFENIAVNHSLDSTQRNARMVFGLLHTLSHLCVKQAALLCGLEATSLSEYVLPRTLTFAIYSNHRFGATIGALTALFEQSLGDWLSAILDARKCIYDPVCREGTGTCHSCCHLAETSCRFYNLNLSRSFLYGGPDKELGEIPFPYFGMDTLTQSAGA
jgi:hypothetical protein